MRASRALPVVVERQHISRDTQHLATEGESGRIIGNRNHLAEVHQHEIPQRIRGTSEFEPSVLSLGVCGLRLKEREALLGVEWRGLQVIQRKMPIPGYLLEKDVDVDRLPYDVEPVAEFTGADQDLKKFRARGGGSLQESSITEWLNPAPRRYTTPGI